MSAAGGSEGTPGDLVEENAVSLWRSWSVWSGAEHREEGGFSILLTAVAHPAFNQIYRLDPDPARFGGLLEAALAPLRKGRLPGFCWIEPGLALRLRGFLEAAGLSRVFTAAGMFAPLPEIRPAGTPPERLAVREVLDDTALDLWCGLVSEVSGFSPPAARAWREIHHLLPFGPGESRRHFTARIGEETAGTASLLFAAGAAGLYSVSVRPEFRRLGIGTALSRHAFEVARDCGWCVGTLVSTPGGVSVYRRLGFREVRRWECWLFTPDGG